MSFFSPTSGGLREEGGRPASRAVAPAWSSSPAAAAPPPPPGGGGYALIDGASEIAALATIHRLWGPPVSAKTLRAVKLARRRRLGGGAAAAAAEAARGTGVWPAAASLPGFMEFSAACSACGGDALSSPAPRPPLLPDGLVSPETLACSCDARHVCAAGAAAPPAGPALWHASAVAALADWAGLAMEPADAAAAAPQAASAGVESAAQVPLGSTPPSRQRAALFDLALRLASLDPARRLSPAAALCSHAALTEPLAPDWEAALREALETLVVFSASVGAARGRSAAARATGARRGGALLFSSRFSDASVDGRGAGHPEAA